ncbi:HK97 family phage prohead protease, partial [Acinetobacter baumannii]|nr:HK97 family phage prohead protease [Acinetobacter baumannii]
MNKVYFKMQEQTVQEDGFFSGYLAVFNNIDSHGDVIRKGAFLKTIEEWNSKGKYPAIFWNHDPDEPIGVFTLMREDEKGLYVEGRLLISDIVRAKSTYALMKVKAIDGMSIGYITIQATHDPQTMIRELLELELVEGSIVAFPSNPNSLISSVKSKLQDGELPSLPEFEKFLRESGFSKTQATVIASKGLRHLLSESEGENE